MFKSLVPLCFYMVTSSAFNLWLELKTGKQESENISKKLLSLCSIFIKVAKKYQDLPHQLCWSTEKGISLFSTASSTSLPPKKETYCSYAVQVQCDPGGYQKS